jgi:hypothetical protein
MTDAAGPPALICGGVCIAADGVAEGTPTRRKNLVGREAIRGLRAVRGFLAPRPLLLALFGVALLAVGLSPVPRLLGWLTSGGTTTDVELLLLILIPLGGWVVYQAAQRGYLLEVDTAAGRRRFEFDATVDAASLEAFLREAEQALGFMVERRFTRE